MIRFSFLVPITIQPAFWVTCLIIAYLNTSFSHADLGLVSMAIWTAVIFISLFVHEMGHALMAKAFRLRPSITLIAFGGQTTYQKEGGLSAAKEFFVTLAGPIFGFGLCALAYVAKGFVTSPIWLLYGVHIAFLVNFYWTFLNLLPILPLDGGQLLRIALQGAFGVRGLKASVWISAVLATICFVGAIFIRQWFLAAFFALFGFESIKTISALKGYRPIDVNPELQRQLEGARALSEQGRAEEAKEVLEAMRDHLERGPLYAEATAELAYISADEGDMQRAFTLFQGVKKRLSPTYLEIFIEVAYQCQEFEEALEAGERLFKLSADKETALFNAKCSAHLGKKNATCGWLEAALKEGISQEVLELPEFSAFREDEVFKKLRS